MAKRAFALPPIDNADCLPHEHAVWRTEACTADGQQRVCVEYPGGAIARTYAGSVPDWERVERWRFGWPPK